MYAFADAGEALTASPSIDLQTFLIEMDTSTFDHASFIDFREARGYWPGWLEDREAKI